MKKWTEQVLAWYHQNKRDFPWRKNKDPYHVWISEIMLQQTRIEAVIAYYNRFMKEIPTVFDLAEVEEEKLLKLWEGLGYYNRARNLKKAAKIIVSNYQGKFPTTYLELLELPGIGEYTASAISSICFGEKKATVDGNVLRVYMRYYNDKSNISDAKTRALVKMKLESMLPDNSGDFNEGIMELGEVICIPNGVPLCSSCPIREGCIAREENTYLNLPVKNKKKEPKKINYTILLFEYQGKIAITKRVNKSLLNNLWEFPNLEGKYSSSDIKNYLDNRNIKYSSVEKSVSYTHVFSHQKWDMISYKIKLKEELNEVDIIMRDIKEVSEEYAIPTAFQPFFQNLVKESTK